MTDQEALRAKELVVKLNKAQTTLLHAQHPDVVRECAERFFDATEELERLRLSVERTGPAAE